MGYPDHERDAKYVQLEREVIRLSGSGKRLSTQRRNGIYSTFTIPSLSRLAAVRNTEKRLRDFGVPEDLRGKTAIDVGCNVGAIALELARRGATVDGVEYNEDRVSLCVALATYYAKVASPLTFEERDSIGRAKFYQTDLNQPAQGWLAAWTDIIMERDESLPEWCRPHDVVLCCSVDEYIRDVSGFYERLRKLCVSGGVLYLESNIQRGVSELDTMRKLREAGFSDLSYLGNGDSGGISRKRKIYRAS